MVRFFSKLFILIGLMVLMGCQGDSGSNSGDPGNGGKNSGKLNPEKRWPETGEFRYSFRYSINGSECEARGVFGKKYQMCLALEDEAANNDCALDSRRAKYNASCGSDFEPKNIPSFEYSGFDSLLDRYCSTARPETFRMPTFQSHCLFLKNESLHESCHWNARKNEFSQWKCPGEFSSPPQKLEPRPTPTPAPTPVPTPTPQPTPPPDLRHPVVIELEAAGIEVTFEGQHGYPSSDPDFRENLIEFYKVLERHKGQILNRKAFIKTLHLASYTTYHSEHLHLSLDVSLKDDLVTYLGLLDRRIALQNEFGLQFDIGIELYRPSDMEKYRQLLAKFESKRTLFQNIKPAVRKIEFKTYSTFWFKDGLLTLEEGKWEAELTRLESFLFGLNNASRLSNGKFLSLDGDYRIFDELAKAQGVLLTLQREKSALDKLANLGKLEVLDFRLSGSTNELYLPEKTLRIGLYEQAPQQLGPTLKAYANLFGRCAELKVDCKLNYDLEDKDIQEAHRRIENRISTLKKKASKISEIEITSYSEYYPSSKKLYLSGSGSLEDFNKAIDSIP